MTRPVSIFRWEEEKREDGVKWRQLEHKGPYFAPPYEPLPDGVCFFYDGEDAESGSSPACAWLPGRGLPVGIRLAPSAPLQASGYERSVPSSCR